MTSHHDHLKGLTPEELLGWLRTRAGPLDLDESSKALFSEFMYQVPYWERGGYWDVHRYYGRHAGKPTPISAFSDFLRATVQEVLGHRHRHLLSVALEVTASSEMHGFHAFDERSGSHAIVLGAQLMFGLPRANMNFLHVVNTHQLGQWTGRYDGQAARLQDFLGLGNKPSVGEPTGKGMLLQGDEDVAHAGRLIARLARELFTEPKDVIPWIIEAEGVEWLVATALVQQLFVLLHEYGHANESWAVGGTPVAHGIILRRISGQAEDLEAEDRADLWAAELLQTGVGSGQVRLDNWGSDVRRFLKQQRWHLPSDPEDMLAFALFLFFEYLHVAGRLRWLKVASGYRPPRARFDRISDKLALRGISQRFVSEKRQLLETLATVALFAGEGRKDGA